MTLARVPEELGEPLELEQVLVRQRASSSRPSCIRARPAGVVVAHDRVALSPGTSPTSSSSCRRISRPSLAELHAVALDALRHARRHLRALEDDEHVVEHDGVLELERGQPRQHLLEPHTVRLERAERLVRLREHVRDGSSW